MLLNLILNILQYNYGYQNCELEYKKYKIVDNDITNKNEYL